MKERSLGASGDEARVTLEWRVLHPNQLWQAAHDPYLCTIVRALDDSGTFYATIVRSGDLYVEVLEDAETLEAAQTWCRSQLPAAG